MLAAIALGSNQGDQLAQFQRARKLLHPFHKEGGERFLMSPVYRTEPVGCPPGSPDFYNAVIALNWERGARSLLGLLQDVEHLQGRVRGRVRNAPRSLDLDLLVLGETILHDPDLEIPHPRLVERQFVLKPLADILPEFVVPGIGRTVSQLLSDCSDKISRPELVTKEW